MLAISTIWTKQRVPDDGRIELYNTMGVKKYSFSVMISFVTSRIITVWNNLAVETFQWRILKPLVKSSQDKYNGGTERLFVWHIKTHRTGPRWSYRREPRAPPRWSSGCLVERSGLRDRWQGLGRWGKIQKRWLGIPGTSRVLFALCH